MNIHHVFSLAPHLTQGGDYRNYHNSTTEKLVQIICFGTTVLTFLGHQAAIENRYAFSSRF